LFFINKQNAAIQKEYIFEGLNNYWNVFFDWVKY
jgi:hypothetical protein